MEGTNISYNPGKHHGLVAMYKRHVIGLLTNRVWADWAHVYAVRRNGYKGTFLSERYDCILQLNGNMTVFDIGLVKIDV